MATWLGGRAILENLEILEKLENLENLAFLEILEFLENLGILVFPEALENPEPPSHHKVGAASARTQPLIFQ